VGCGWGGMVLFPGWRRGCGGAGGPPFPHSLPPPTWSAPTPFFPSRPPLSPLVDVSPSIRPRARLSSPHSSSRGPPPSPSDSPPARAAPPPLLTTSLRRRPLTSAPSYPSPTGQQSSPFSAAVAGLLCAQSTSIPHFAETSSRPANSPLSLPRHPATLRAPSPSPCPVPPDPAQPRHVARFNCSGRDTSPPPSSTPSSGLIPPPRPAQDPFPLRAWLTAAPHPSLEPPPAPYAPPRRPRRASPARGPPPRPPSLSLVSVFFPPPISPSHSNPSSQARRGPWYYGPRLCPRPLSHLGSPPVDPTFRSALPLFPSPPAFYRSRPVSYSCWTPPVVCPLLPAGLSHSLSAAHLSARSPRPAPLSWHSSCSRPPPGAAPERAPPPCAPPFLSLGIPGRALFLHSSRPRSRRNGCLAPGFSSPSWPLRLQHPPASTRPTTKYPCHSVPIPYDPLQIHPSSLHLTPAPLPKVVLPPPSRGPPPRAGDLARLSPMWNTPSPQRLPPLLATPRFCTYLPRPSPLLSRPPVPQPQPPSHGRALPLRHSPLARARPPPPPHIDILFCSPGPRIGP